MCKKQSYIMLLEEMIRSEVEGVELGGVRAREGTVSHTVCICLNFTNGLLVTTN